MGHLGMLPQRVLEEGGYRKKGKTPEQAEAHPRGRAGAHRGRGVPPLSSNRSSRQPRGLLSESLAVPTIGIGCGDHTCDGEVAVVTDLLGSFPWFVPPFAKPEADLAGATREAVATLRCAGLRRLIATDPSVLLYLHIPFCHRVCPYCSFYKHTPGATPIGAFIDALAAEARHRHRRGRGRRARSTSAAALRACSRHATSRACLPRCMKSSISRNSTKSRWKPTPPPSMWPKPGLFRELGVTRVSLGIQSFSPHVLETLGREHTRRAGRANPWPSCARPASRRSTST